MSLGRILSKAVSGKRLGFKEAMFLYMEAELLDLGDAAQEVREKWNPNNEVTYAVDRNINYTNVCVSKCAFCAFHRGEAHPEAYVLDPETLVKKCQETLALGGTHVLFQGGLHPGLTLPWHEAAVSMIRGCGLHVHGYSPPEILFLSEQSGLSIAEVLGRLREAGLGSIPGGGAEILCDRVRRRISPKKAGSRAWLRVMETAHEMGLRTTATMMFGHLETPNERIVHLLRIRNLQDRTNGFTAFIPWPYQPGKHTIQTQSVGGVGYLRLLALSRLVLDNVPHIQASWVTQGPAVGQVALHFGADDMGSTMIEENVVAAAGVRHRLNETRLRRLIREAGYVPRKRDALYGKAEAT